MAVRTCLHEKYDAAWSHGHVWRCLDCGATNDRILGNGEWQHPEDKLRECERAGKTEAAAAYREYIRIAKERGIPREPERFVFPEHDTIQ